MASKILKTWLGLVVCGCVWVESTWADVVTDWNEIAQAAIATGRPGAPGALDSALVQVAVYDAVQAIDRRFEPYFAEVPGATGSRAAAAAAAAHGVLVALYPSQAAALDVTYGNYLATNGLDGDPGLDVGVAVAAKILPLYRAVPNPPPPAFIGGTLPGEWRPTDSFITTSPPPPFSPMLAPWMATTDPFTLTGSARFRAPVPPALTSEQYARDFNEVKRLGSATSTDRTAEQTDIAYFYSENFIAQLNRMLRGIANQNLRKTSDSARLFALANLAMADAAITAWDTKKFYNFWRPLTAIREAASDGNPATEADSNWKPLINNPNYPDYTSGANNLTAATMTTLQLFFKRDRMTFEVTSNAPLAVKKSRTYRNFSDVMTDVVNARIYLGIHFRAADVAAREQGSKVATWAFEHFLGPVSDDRRDKHDDEQH